MKWFKRQGKEEQDRGELDENGRPVLQQDLSQKAEDAHLFPMWLLFDHEPVKPGAETVQAALEARLGPVDLVSPGDLTSFAVRKYTGHFKDADLPPQVALFQPQPFRPESVGPLERSQLWNVRDGEALLDRCTHQLLLSDLLDALAYRERCELLMDWLETAVGLFPDCAAVWIPTAGKLFTAEQVRRHDVPREDRFLYFAVNARFFRVQGGEDMVVDTLGLYALGLPDVQLHFRGLEPNAVVNHAYNIAAYLFQNDAPIRDGETVDGLEGGQLSREVRWPCRYEDALIQPVRPVLDVCPGPYAAGGRGEEA